jgi:hypothetical protein
MAACAVASDSHAEGRYREEEPAASAAADSSAAAAAAARGNIAAASEEEAELESLRRTRRLLMEQIAQMDASMGQLTDSDAVIAALTTGIEGCDGEMGRGKKMLRRISQLDSADDRVVAVAWCVFFATLAYVWGQRIFGLF